VSQAGSISTFQLRIDQLDLGGFIGEEINYDDKIIGYLGVRADKSSNNPDPNELFWYPKASLAVNIATAYNMAFRFIFFLREFFFSTILTIAHLFIVVIYLASKQLFSFVKKKHFALTGPYHPHHLQYLSSC